MSIGHHLKDTTRSAGRLPIGTIIEKKKGGRVYWVLAVLLIYWVVASVYMPSLLPGWASKLFWTLASIRS